MRNGIELLLNPLKSKLTADIDNEGGIWLKVFGEEITVFHAVVVYKAFIGYDLDALSFDLDKAASRITGLIDEVRLHARRLTHVSTLLLPPLQ